MKKMVSSLFFLVSNCSTKSAKRLWKITTKKGSNPDLVASDREKLMSQALIKKGIS
jgi:hypothetical protein